MQEPQFSIGEAAELSGLSTQTLRYYNKIDLVKPAFVDTESQYRYYSSQQIMILNVITNLKECGLSLSDIRNFLFQETLDHVPKMLIQQRNIIREEKRQLNLREQKVNELLNTIQSGLSISGFSTVQLKQLPKREVVFLKMEDCGGIENVVLCVSDLIKLSQKYQWSILGKPIFINSDFLGSTSQGNFGMDVCLQVSEITKPNMYGKTIRGGTYACIYHKGLYNTIFNSCQVVYDWIRESQFQVIGPPITAIIVDIPMITNFTNLVTEIQIPVKKLK